MMCHLAVESTLAQVLSVYRTSADVSQNNERHHPVGNFVRSLLRKRLEFQFCSGALVACNQSELFGVRWRGCWRRGRTGSTRWCVKEENFMHTVLNQKSAFEALKFLETRRLYRELSRRCGNATTLSKRFSRR